MTTRAHLHYLGVQNYEPLWRAMQEKNKAMDWPRDEWWITEHLPVYTLGAQGGREHLHDPNPTIPVIHTDRGGSITYHGPGQLVIYPQLHVRTHTSSVTVLVDRLEQLVFDWMSRFMEGLERIPTQRGLYIKKQKIASIGLKISNGKTYHGISINVAMDLSPFDKMNPCGYPGLRMTQWLDHAAFPEDWYLSLESAVCDTFGYTAMTREYPHAGQHTSQITWPR